MSQSDESERMSMESISDGGGSMQSDYDESSEEEASEDEDDSSIDTPTDAPRTGNHTFFNPRATKRKHPDDDAVYQPVQKKQKLLERAMVNANMTQLTGNDLVSAVASLYLNSSSETTPAAQPSSIVLDMKAHQLQGLSWLQGLYQKGLGGILGDEMGVGKTLQVIALCAWLKEVGEIGWEKKLPPVLIVVPLSTLPNWVEEIAKFSGTALGVCAYHGTKQEREALRNEVSAALRSAGIAKSGTFFWPGVDVVLSTPELLQIDDFFLTQFDYPAFIVDEGHRYKNPKLSKFLSFSKKQRGLGHITRKYLLTGTPLQNDITELYSLLSVVCPSLFCNTHRKTEEGKTNMQVFCEATKIKHVQSILHYMMLRRTKDTVLTLPPKTEYVLHCPLSPLQTLLYKSVLKRVAGEVIGGGKTTRMQNTVMQLRKCCSHPYLFPGVEKEPFELGEHLALNSSKLVMLDKMLTHFKALGRNVLIFSQFTAILDILQDFLNYKDYAHERLDGSMRLDKRSDAVNNFKSLDQDVFIFLLSTRAGGLGLNLTKADTVIFFDSDWNPQVDKQAQERVHRLGQTKPVEVFRLSSEGTIEDLMLARSIKKMQLATTVMEEKQAEVGEKNVELQTLIKASAAALLTDETDADSGPAAQLSIQDFVLTDTQSCDDVLSSMQAKGAVPKALLTELNAYRAYLALNVKDILAKAKIVKVTKPKEATITAESSILPTVGPSKTHMVYEGVDYHAMEQMAKKTDTVADNLSKLQPKAQHLPPSADVVGALLAGKVAQIHTCTIDVATGALQQQNHPTATHPTDTIEEEPATPLTPLEQEEKRRARLRKRWGEQGYASRAVLSPLIEGSGLCAAERMVATLRGGAANDDVSFDGVYHVRGDATRPESARKVAELLSLMKENGAEHNVVHLVLMPVDNSGVWGDGGMFRAIDTTFGAHTVSKTYTKAKAAGDMRLGDTHLVKISYKVSVALMVVLRAVDKGATVKTALLTEALEKVQATCTLLREQGATPFVHIPRFANADWVSVEKHISNYLSSTASVFIYYYKK